MFFVVEVVFLVNVCESQIISRQLRIAVGRALLIWIFTKCWCVQIPWMKDAWTHHDLYWDLHSPVCQEASNSKRSATHRHFPHHTTTLLHLCLFFSFHLQPLCIQPLWGGWALGQPLHLWKICVWKMSSFYTWQWTRFEQVSMASSVVTSEKQHSETLRYILNHTANKRSKYVYEVLIPSLLFGLEPMQRQGSLLQWLLLVHLVPVPADCVCRWADWQWSPLHGFSEQGLHHPICPDDPPFETGRTRGIGERWVREREKRGKEGQSSLV